MMKKYNYYLVFFLLMLFGQIRAGIYPNYSQNIGVPDVNNNGQSGTGGGTISIINDVLSINISATWASPSYLKIGTVATLNISLPNMELGQLSSAPGSPLSNFAAKIENNKLVFYLTNSPTQWYSCYFSFTKNLACDVAYTWYLDDDLDGLGDPLNFIAQQCTKPNGNYVRDNTDNCPMISGTNVNCASLEPVISNRNSIKNITYKTATTTSITNPTIAQANQNIAYFDGLGRPVQNTAYQYSATGKDIVTPIEYDDFGRQSREYLPYASTQNNLNYIDPTTLIPNLIAQYQTKYGAANSNPFSEKQLEASPLSRVLQQAAPGSDWSLANNHTIKMDYQTNLDNEVKFYIANATWNSGLGLYEISLNYGSGNGFYVANQLYKTITYDENTTVSPIETNGSTVEFKNKEGQVVLKRTYDAGVKHDTYYVYDPYGNLTYVIPPKASDLINSSSAQSDVTSTAVVNFGNSFQLTATNSIRLLPGFNAVAGSTFSTSIISNQSTLDNLCYQYKYDSRNRLVEKKLPGKQWEFIVYDKLDRAVATGPAFSPFTDIASIGWSVTKYDALNRPVLTAWLPATTITAADRKALQDTQNSVSINFSETKTATTTNTTINGIAFRYSTVAWPLSDYHVLTVNYYDDYNYPGSQTIPATVETQNVYYNNSVKPLGLATGSWNRIMEASTTYRNELAYTLYDIKARPIRVYSQNFLGGYAYTDSKLDEFSGQLQYNITRHKRLASDSELTTKEVFTYSDQDRLLTQTHQINAGTIELIANNTYDELGQLTSKKVGNTTVAPTQKVDYTYNIRGWMTNINDINSLTQSGDPKDQFAFRINYNTTATGITDVKALYNGNIAETFWTSASEVSPVTRSYGYKYDNLNRLKDAIFQRAATTNNAYNENLTYDKNGNILSLTRNGSNETSATLIDNLVYSYGANNLTNQLTTVIDNAPTVSKTNGFVDSTTNSVDDYSYDANGNMIKDNNKNITAITYNNLNLPIKITFTTTGNIVYLYNATGQKVQKIVTTVAPSTTTTIDYLGGYQYNNNVLKFFPTAEGYVEGVSGSYKYVYQYKDHLGNIRLSYDKNLAIQEESNYYPFGLKQIGYNGGINSTNDALKFKFQGQERQDELSLNWDSFKWRNYDYAIGRFMSIDPLSEKYVHNGVYNFSENRVIDARELEGLESVQINKGTKNLIIAVQGWHNGNPGPGKTQVTPDSNSFSSALVKAYGSQEGTQVAVFNPSMNSRTPDDISKSIVDFRAESPDGKLVIAGFSLGADNAVNAVNDNPSVKVDKLITLDISDPLGKADNQIPSNVAVAKNYSQPNDTFVGGTQVEAASGNTTSVITNVQTTSETTHSTIDNNYRNNVVKEVKKVIP